MKKTKYFIIIILILGILFNICFCKKYPTFAIEGEYSNQLLKLNLEKVDDNTINIKVYSSKPYPIELSPIKKDNGEYIIFLPETYHSITSKPNILPYTKYINDIDVKLVPYTSSNSNNGYTQISVKTVGENVKINVDNEISQQDFKFQEELTKILISKPKDSVQLRPKKAEENLQQVSNTTPKQKNTTNLINTVSKSTTPSKKINKETKKEPSKAPATKTPEKAVLSSQTKPAKQDNLKTTNINEKKPETKEIKEKTPEAKAQTPEKPDNISTAEKTQNVENADISENTKNKTQEIATEELTDNSDNLTVVANSTNLATTEVQPITNKTKKSNNFFNILFPAIIAIILILITFRLIKKIVSKKNDSPIKIVNQPEHELQFAQSYKETRQSNEHEVNAETVLQGPIEDMIAKSQIKPQNNKPEDIITRLTQNPLKPPQTNPLRTKEYTEISPNQLNIDHNKIKSNETSSDELKFIASIEISNEKSFHLIQLENKKALIGVIGSEIFVLAEFDRVKSPKFIVRKTDQEHRSDKDVYFVQVGTWSALVSSEKDIMKLETVF
ncbi:MAG: hypothetical protein ACD_20C00198G0006 [uncultured bacterium]|nr:MAG: hypothetical protein ACD_20C00198G0006 [uncultured bacterium]